eukprot:jgi/Chrzof1/3297/Cz12g20010.t1
MYHQRPPSLVGGAAQLSAGVALQGPQQLNISMAGGAHSSGNLYQPASAVPHLLPVNQAGPNPQQVQQQLNISMALSRNFPMVQNLTHNVQQMPHAPLFTVAQLVAPTFSQQAPPNHAPLAVANVPHGGQPIRPPTPPPLPQSTQPPWHASSHAPAMHSIQQQPQQQPQQQHLQQQQQQQQHHQLQQHPQPYSTQGVTFQALGPLVQQPRPPPMQQVAVMQPRPPPGSPGFNVAHQAVPPPNPPPAGPQAASGNNSSASLNSMLWEQKGNLEVCADFGKLWLQRLLST